MAWHESTASKHSARFSLLDDLPLAHDLIFSTHDGNVFAVCFAVAALTMSFPSE